MTTDARRRRPFRSAIGLGILTTCLLLTVPAGLADEKPDAAAPKPAFVPGMANLAFHEQVGDVVVRQYELEPMSQLSYLVGSGGEAVVVDPLRDVDLYLREAASLGLTIKTVVLTHTHTDFVAGHAELAARVGATVLVHPDMPATFPHEDAREGADWKLGEATLEILWTPGPTNDGLTVLVHAPQTSVKPLYALTGDALWITDLGRPEGLAGTPKAQHLAASAFDVVQQLKLLPAEARILPAHGGGPFRGRDLGEATVARVQELSRVNPFVATESRPAFVTRVLSHLPSKTPYADLVLRWNREGPPLRSAGSSPAAPPVPPREVAAALEKGAWLVDLRMPDAYAKGHVSGAINIPIAGRLETWFAMVIPRDAAAYLLGSDEAVREAMARLPRTGFDQLAGALEGGMEAWAKAGLAVRTSLLIDAKELKRRMDAWIEPVLVDIRPPKQYAARRLGEIANIPLTKPKLFAALLDPSRPLLTICKVGFRSTIAVGLLERMGFERAGSLDGGVDAWVKAALPTVGEKATR